MTYEYKQYLAHHGIKGMKWGVRRYQNEDGTLTAEGKKRYSEADTWEKDEAKTLSNEELDRRNTRMQKESQYRQNIENRHPVQKEAKSTAEKIFLATAVGAASAVMSKKYKDKLDGEAVKKVVSSGKKFLHNNRRLLGLGLGVATIKGAEYWKQKNDNEGKTNDFSDFAYRHRGALGVAAYVAVNKIAKHLNRS